MGQFFYIIVYKGDVRRIHRNITAYTAHGNANLSFFQGRSIIDPIADHTHQFSLGLVDINSFQFIFRQTVGPNCPDMELRGDGVGGIFMVTCEQHRIYIQTGKCVDHLAALLPDGVRKGNPTRKATVHC